MAKRPLSMILRTMLFLAITHCASTSDPVVLLQTRFRRKSPSTPGLRGDLTTVNVTTSGSTAGGAAEAIARRVDRETTRTDFESSTTQHARRTSNQDVDDILKRAESAREGEVSETVRAEAESELKLLIPPNVLKSDASSSKTSSSENAEGPRSEDDPCASEKPHVRPIVGDPCHSEEDENISKLRRAAAATGATGLEALEPNGVVVVETWRKMPRSLARKFTDTKGRGPL
eukprot:g2063.t1